MKNKYLKLSAALFMVVVFLLEDFSYSCDKKIFLSVNEYADDFDSMKVRAEDFVNYEWIPSQDIDVWNQNPYNGKMIFPAGEKIRGVPYTLFTYEMGFDSLLSLKQYKTKAADNYSATAYCNSMGATRTGPVYGSCCATFVSEVFGGKYMSGDNPKDDSVYKIRKNPGGSTVSGVKAYDIRPGDGLSNISQSHIVWVGEVTEDGITIYEETPPIARKVFLSFSEHINSQGYLHYGDSSNENSNTYNVVTRPHSLTDLPPDAPEDIDERYPVPFTAYTLSYDGTEIYEDRSTHKECGRISGEEECSVLRVYKDGYCFVNIPSDSTGSRINVYAELSAFIAPSIEPSVEKTDKKIDTYKRSDMSQEWGWAGAGDEVTVTGNCGVCSQFIYPLLSGGYKCAWGILKIPEHECDKGTFLYYEPEHPHRKVYRCSVCSAVWTDEESSSYCESCPLCNIPGKPVLIDMKESYLETENVIFRWNETVHTSHYSLWVYKKNADENWEPYVYENYVKQDFSVKVTPGKYKAVITAYNSSFTEEGSNEWLNTVGDDCFFSCQEPYKIEFDANGGKNAPARQLKNPGEEIVIDAGIPFRQGHTFVGWGLAPDSGEIFINPGDTYINDESVYLYAIWKKTTVPGDINGDGIVNNKDLTRLMKYLSGEDVSVISENLDVNGDGVVNNKDLTRLMKYCAGESVQLHNKNT